MDVDIAEFFIFVNSDEDRNLFYFEVDFSVRQPDTPRCHPRNSCEKEEVAMSLFKSWQGAAWLLLVALAGCTQQQQSPQQIREKTAEATAEAKNDAKAVVEGVKEGWDNSKAVDVNSASRDQLMALPGMSATAADRVIAGRPYDRVDDLLTRHIIVKSEYDRISGQITVHK
jgi:DNA uptake protein ComE-like DNA-binding protein